jgi:hypothetical protein
MFSSSSRPVQKRLTDKSNEIFQNPMNGIKTTPKMIGYVHFCMAQNILVSEL